MSKLMLILVLNGLLADATPALDNAVTVKLQSQNNSGQHGSATLLPRGNKTRVVIRLFGMPAGVAPAAHIHLGSCDQLDKAPRWVLKAVQDGRSVTVVPASIGALLKDKAAINIHPGTTAPQIEGACGNIIAAK